MQKNKSFVQKKESEVSGNHPVKNVEKPTLEELEKRLNVQLDGLQQDEAQKRIAQYGYNELPEKKVNPIIEFLTYFWGPIPWMIEIAAILSAVVQHWSDFIVIMALLLVNSVVGFWEEHQAGNAIAALKSKLAIRAKVKRSGEWVQIPACELVPGDIIRLRLGDIIPADAMLLPGDPIEVDQSALTGESLPVTHNAGETVYSGSIVRIGEIDSLVYATGKNTYFGKTAELVSEASTPSHFQRAVLDIGKYLIFVAIIIVAVILAVAIIRGDPLITTLQFALVLTVAAVPVAMPTVLSVTMAVGAKLLSIKEVIVSRLASIEELAGIDILCSDKTGTLTQNKLSLGDPACFDGISQTDLIAYAGLASRSEDQDPIDLAIINDKRSDHHWADYKIKHFMPFDPVNKRTEALIESPNGETFKVSKGAPQVILGLLKGQGDVQAKINTAVNDFAVHGYRSLGVARTIQDGTWQYLGVIPLFDPPREDSKLTIEEAQQLGIGVKMVTGDQIAIGREIGQQLGLGNNILDAGLFATQENTSEVLEAEIEKADVFAQVFPEHKFRIVETLQKHDHIVGMTGDGVNDAPALKKADAGIAVAGATDAARAAADLVLMTPGLSVIIDAVKESRRIFQRMNSYAIYRIAETIRVLLFMALSILVFNFYPVTAIMIVLLALLNDGAIISIAYDRVHISSNPEKWNMRSILGVASLVGLSGVIESFLLFFVCENVFHIDRSLIQTLIYLKLSVAGHLTIFVTRTRKSFWSIRPSKVLFLAVLITQIVATTIATTGLFMTAIPIWWALLVWAYALTWFVFEDQIKKLAYKIFASEKVSILEEA